MSQNALNSALEAAQTHLARVKSAVAEKVAGDRAGVDAHQHEAHGLSFAATTIEALTQLLGWYERLDAPSAADTLILQIGFGEYLSQLRHGVPMSQSEFARPSDWGLTTGALDTPEIDRLIAEGTSQEAKRALADELAKGHFGTPGLDDTMEMVRGQFHRFAEARVKPHAHGWHLRDELIPLEILDEMAGLGVFGLTVPEQFGGAGLSKIAMCIVSEELSRGYIGVGSLGTRSEIAAELILGGGTKAQKDRFLPEIASGRMIPTAVFTEPNVGSDLGSLTTRAVRDGARYRITGAKNWITHAARADVMTLLARTSPDEKGYRGLSMFLAEKPRGTADAPFPAPGMSGSEIPVLGYRGMKEFALGFDGFEVPAANLLGEEEGQGFKQLMRTFESARIQTAARAVGVAQSALEIGLSYALDRSQFGQPIFAYPRVHNKLALMAVETQIARQLTFFAAREKDSGARCDLEAGMAKLLAARIAWANADNAVQIHGGNGFALEYEVSRVLCDARILSIFEGAAEIQAQVIARRLIEGAN